MTTYPVMNSADIAAANGALSPDYIGSLFPNFSAGLARILSNGGDASMALLGDSLSFSTGVADSDYNAYSYEQSLVNEFSVYGITSTWDSIWGVPSGFSFSGIASRDTRFTYSGIGWTGNTVSIAGNMYSNTADTTSWIAFTPAKQVNAFKLWYPADPQFGTISVSIDGGTAQNISLAQKNGVWNWDGSAWSTTTAPSSTSNDFGSAKITVSTVGTHTIKILRVSGNCKISGIEGYRTDISQLRIYNWGRPGETTTGWATGTSYWNYLGVMGQNLKPDLTIIELGKNDENTGIAPSVTEANLQALYGVSQASVAKDVAAVVTSSSSTSAIPQATQDATSAAIKAAAIAANVPIILNHPLRFGNYASGNARGLYASGDSTHLSNLGYRAKARAIRSALISNF